MVSKHKRLLLTNSIRYTDIGLVQLGQLGLGTFGQVQAPKSTFGFAWKCVALEVH